MLNDARQQNHLYYAMMDSTQEKQGQAYTPNTNSITYLVKREKPIFTRFSSCNTLPSKLLQSHLFIKTYTKGKSLHNICRACVFWVSLSCFSESNSQFSRIKHCVISTHKDIPQDPAPPEP